MNKENITWISGLGFAAAYFKSIALCLIEIVVISSGTLLIAGTSLRVITWG